MHPRTQTTQRNLPKLGLPTRPIRLFVLAGASCLFAITAHADCIPHTTTGPLMVDCGDPQPARLEESGASFKQDKTHLEAGHVKRERDAPSAKPPKSGNATPTRSEPQFRPGR